MNDRGGTLVRKCIRLLEKNPMDRQELKPDETTSLLAAIVNSSDDAIVSKTLEGLSRRGTVAPKYSVIALLRPLVSRLR